MLPLRIARNRYGRIVDVVGAVVLATVIGLIWGLALAISTPQHILAAEVSTSVRDDAPVANAGPTLFREPSVDQPLVAPTAPLRQSLGEAESLSLTTSVATALLSPTSVTVTAYDISGSVAISYTGALSFTSSDTRATLPDVYTYTVEDQGAHIFVDAVTFRTPGSQWLCVRDTMSPSLAVTVTYVVSENIVIDADTTWQDETITVGDMAVTNGATLYLGGSTVITAENIVIEPLASLNADKGGWAADTDPDLGLGAGAGHGGFGGDGWDAPGGTPYGDVYHPTDMGRGTRTYGPAGAAGGGSIHLIVTDSLVVEGILTANGGDGGKGAIYQPGSAGGSGGSIWIETHILTGTGTIRANGGRGGKGSKAPSAGGGAGGRIALYLDHYDFGILLQARGGDSSGPVGGPGTVFIAHEGTTLLIDNGGVDGASAAISSDSYIFDTIRLTNYGHLTVLSTTSELTLTNTTLASGDGSARLIGEGTLYAPEEFTIRGATVAPQGVFSGPTVLTTTAQGGLILYASSLESGVYTYTRLFIDDGTVTTLVPQVTDPYTASIGFGLHLQQLTIVEGGILSSDGLGYGAGKGPGLSSANSAGAGHGGIGGTNVAGDMGGAAYDDLYYPIYPGSGSRTIIYGSGLAVGATGGGAIHLVVSDTLALDGIISANGTNGGAGGLIAGAGGGSGGSILIEAGVLTGTGTLRANGGDGGIGYRVSDGGGGAGGRIALYLDSDEFNGSVQSRGGSNYESQNHGGPGTVYVESGQYSELRVDNGGLDGMTAALLADVYTFDTISMTNFGHLTILSATSELTLTNTASVSGDGSARLIAEGALYAPDEFTVRGATIVPQGVFSGPTILTTTAQGGLEFLASASGVYTYTSLFIDGGTTVSLVPETSEPYTASKGVQLHLQRLTVAEGGILSSDGLGYGAGEGPGLGSVGGTGAGHGGIGGTNVAGDMGGPTYDDLYYPIYPGSGSHTIIYGSGLAAGAVGGGTMHLVVNDTLTLDGIISANGTNGGAGGLIAGAGGGSGGSILIEAGVLTGTGVLRANGGIGGTGYNSNNGGGGAGGRIAVYATQDSFAENGTIEILGGSFDSLGEDGTVYLDYIEPVSSTLFIDPSSVIADGSSSAQVVVTLVTTAGQAAANEPVYLKLLEGSTLYINGQSVAPHASISVGSTDANGVVTAVLTSTIAETRTLIAWAGPVPLAETADVVFVAGTPDADKGQVTASPTSVTADGSSASTIGIKVYDAYLNPVPNVTVTLSAAGDGVQLTQPTVQTDATGQAFGTIRSTETGVVTISATADGILLSDTASVTFVSADLSVSKTSVATVLAGDLLTYTLEVKNEGELVAPGVVLTDTLPISFTYVAHTSTVSPSIVGRDVVWSIGSLASQAESAFDLVVHVAGDIPNGASRTNHVAATTTAFEGSVEDNAAESSVTVYQPEPLLALAPQYSTVELQRGTLVTTVLELANTGTKAAQNIELHTPAHLPWVQITPSIVTAVAPGATIPVTVTLAPAGDISVGTYRDTIEVESEGTIVTGAALSLRLAGITRTLAVTVEGVSGSVPDASVLLTRHDPTIEVTDGVTREVHQEAQAVTNQDGLATLVGLETGTYDYTVVSGGYGAATGVVTVTAGSDLQLWSVTLQGLPVLVPEPRYPELYVRSGELGIVNTAVRNVGLGSAANVEVLLRDAPDWLSVGVSGVSDVLASEQALSVTLFATPPATLTTPSLYQIYVDVTADGVAGGAFALTVRVGEWETGTLQLHIADDAGTPLPDAKVTLLNKKPTLIVSGGVTRTTYESYVKESDAGGVVSFEGIPAGQYGYYVDAEGYKAIEVDPTIPPGGTCVGSVILEELPFEAQWHVRETEITDVYSVTVELTFQADQLQVLPLEIVGPCDGGSVSGVIEVLNPSAYPATNVQVTARIPGVSMQISGQGASIAAGETATFPFTADVDKDAFGEGWIAAGADDVDGNSAPARVSTLCTGGSSEWSWRWSGGVTTIIVGDYVGSNPAFPGIDPPPYQGMSDIELKLSQSAMFERQAFLAELTLSNAISDVTGIEVRITARDPEGVSQPTHFTVTPTVPTALPGISPYSGPVQQQWTLVPAYLGITVPTTYTLRATLVYTVGDQVYISDSLPAVILVRPQPEVHVEYFLPEHVRANEPILLGVRAKNLGAGVAKDLRIASALPQIVDQQGRPVGFRMLGTYEQGALNDGDLLLNFGNLEGGAETIGGWMMTFSYNGTFTNLDVHCEHQDYQGMTLSNLLYCDGGQNVFDNDLQHLNENECPDMSAYDKQGVVGGPINTRSGNYNYAVTDLSLPTSGDSLVMARTYNSTAVFSDTDTLSPGWTHRYAMRLEFPDMSAGTFFTATTGNAVIDRSTIYYRPYVVVRLPGGSRLRLADNGNGTFSTYPGAQTQLATQEAGGVVSYTFTAADETLRVFDAAGQLRVIRDRHGNETTLSYDPQGHLTRVAGPTDLRYLDFGYDAQDRLSWVRDVADRTVRYGYDLTGDLSVMTDTRGMAWTYTYTGAHLLHEVFDPAGQLVERTGYISSTVGDHTTWRAAYQEDGAGMVLALDYDELGTTISEAGQERLHRYDVFGALSGETDAAGYVQGTEFNADFRPVAQTDPLGRTTEMAWQGCCGQLAAITDTLGHTTQLTYDAHNNLTGYVDAVGNLTSYIYDAANNLVVTTDAAGAVTRYAYDSHGNVISTTTAGGMTTLYVYDDFGQRTSTTGPDGLTTAYGYDAVGRLITTTASTGLVTVNEYDDAATAGDNLIRVTRNVTTAGGQNYLGIYNQVTTYGYDVVGRRTHVTDTQGLVTTTEYDAAGRVIRTTRNTLSGYAQNYYIPPSQGGTEGGYYNLVTEYGYDGLGRQILVTDTLDSVTYTEYDELGRVVRTWQHYLPGHAQNDYIPSSQGGAEGGYYNLVTAYAYDAVGNQTHVTDTLGSVTYTEYDDLNRVLRTWRNYLPGHSQNDYIPSSQGGPEGGYCNLVTAYAYDAVGNQVWVTDTLGSATYTEYDDLNRPITVTTNYVNGVYDAAFPDEDLVQITTYDTAGRVLTTRDPASRLTYHEYDAAGRPVTITTNYVDGIYDAAHSDEDVKQVTVYDPSTGRVTARLQVAGTTIPTTYGYDVLGRLVTTTNALSGTTVTQYDALGRRAATVDAEGTVTRYGYDVAGRLVTTTNALSGTVVTTYDALGRRVAQTNPLGHTGVYTYDVAGRLVAQADPMGNTTRYAYDALGRRTVITDADGVAATSVYNTLGQLVATADGLGNTTAYVYDALGRRTVMTDANGVATGYEYDDQGRLIAVVENQRTGESANRETNVRTEYVYDALGSLTTITDALGHTTVYTYDLAGRCLSEADALGHVTGYTYDGHGRRTGVAYPDAGGPFTVTMAYNALGWATDVVYPGIGETPGFTVTYGYNALGHREAVTDATGTMAYDYDALYRPLDIDAPAGDVTYTYDAAGQRTHLIYPTGEVVTYTHDVAGRLHTVTDWDGGVTVYTYTAAGRLSGMACPNGVTSAYGYDDAGRLVEIEHRDGDNDLLARYAYTLDGMGNRTAVTETLLTPADTQAGILDLENQGLAMSLLSDSEPEAGVMPATRLPGLMRLLAVPASQEAAETAVTQSADPPADWSEAALANLQQAEYRVTWSTETALADVPSAYQAPNRAHDFRTYFVADGVRVVPRTETRAAWELHVSLTGYGYETGDTPVLAGRPEVTDQSVRYRRGTLEEWYVNDTRGLEQGFTLSAPPEVGDGRLALDLSFGGMLTATLADTQAEGAYSAALEFISPEGERVLRYGDLYAHDALGRELPVELVPLATGAPLTVAATSPDDVVPATTVLTGTAALLDEPAFDVDSASQQAIVDGVRLLVDVRDAVYPITVDPLLSSPGWTAESDQADAQFGYAVSSAGDVNGDGYDDVIVGAPYYDNGQTNEGRAYVYHGSANGLSAAPVWTAESNQASAYFGWSVAGTGDVNGDGYADVIVGAYVYDNGQSDEGRAYVYYGSANGLNTASAWTAESDQAHAYFGWSVGGAGDVNGDGYDDVVVGSPQDGGVLWGTEDTYEGKAYTFYGSSSGLSTTPDWVEEGNQMFAYFGHSVAGAGDVNGDGYADVIVGAYAYDNGQSDEGRAYVYHGSANGLSASSAWTAESDQVSAYFGWSVAGVGDANGDGYSDVIVGAYAYDNGQSDEGRAYVYHGSANGLSATSAWTAESNQAGARFGWSVAGTGDVGGDGYDDVIVGAPYYDNGQTDEGRAYGFYGSTSGLNATAAWTAESNQTSAYFGVSVGSAGEVNGDDCYDAIIGAYYYDNGQTNEGRAFLYHGQPVAISGLVATNDSPTVLGRSTLLTATISAGTHVSYTWAFGDGTTGSGAVVTHVYPNVGNYTATVTASSSTNTATATTQVTVTDVPIAGLMATSSSPTVLGQSTVLTVAVSAGSNVSYAWDFGDGATGSGRVVGHTYPEAGTYTATVTASNSVNTVTAPTIVTITDVPIVGLMVTSSSPTVLGQSTVLTAAVSTGSNVSYAWGFGDDTLGSGAVVTHTYAGVGSYTAVVTATNSASTVTATTQVTITAAPPVTVTRTITYTYDPLNRLTAATYSTGEIYVYQYDVVGNRTAMTDTTGTTSYTYDVANRLTNIQSPTSNIAYTWDDRGNLTHDGVFTYTYSAAGRMVRAESVTATLLYTYTVDGLRIAQDVGGVVTSFAWDWATGVPEMLSDGENLYLVGHDTLGWEDTEGWTHVLPDALGSVRQTADASGAVVDVREWTPYGVEEGEAQAGLGYTGEWFDNGVGLQYLRVRWYDAVSGRFTQVDPSRAEQNPYLYVQASPLNAVDPTGLYSVRVVQGTNAYGGLAVRGFPSEYSLLLRRVPDGTQVIVHPDYPLPTTDPSASVKWWYKVVAIGPEFIGNVFGPWVAMDYLGTAVTSPPAPGTPSSPLAPPMPGPVSEGGVLPLDAPITYWNGYGYYNWSENANGSCSACETFQQPELEHCDYPCNLCFHNGWDMVSDTSTTVKAMWDGRVQWKNSMIVHIAHNVNGQSVDVQYTHVRAEPGLPEQVVRGQKIGDYGPFGTPYPHLHLSFLVGGEVRNPALYWPGGPVSFIYGNPVVLGP